MRTAARDVRALAVSYTMSKRSTGSRAQSPCYPRTIRPQTDRRTLDSGGEYSIEERAYPRPTVSSDEVASAASQSSAAVSGGVFSARARRQLQAPPAP